MPSATPEEVSRNHLSTLRQLRAHVNTVGKAGAYRALLRDLGIDPALAATADAKPRLYLAEQAGCWMTVEDMNRVALLRALRDAIPTHPSSGLRMLGRDTLSSGGVKMLFLRFGLHPQLGEVPLLGSTTLRRHRQSSVDSVPFEGDTRRRVEEVLEASQHLLEAASRSPEAYHRVVHQYLRSGHVPHLRGLFPRQLDREGVLGFAEELRRHMLGDAAALLHDAREAMRGAERWGEAWRDATRAITGEPIEWLGPELNHALLAVVDPVRHAERMRELLGAPPERPLPIAGLITEESKYRMVYWHEGRFVWLPEKQKPEPISWAEVREHAESGQAGGLAAVAEYLCLAAAGVYLIADPRDGRSPFEQAARRIHADHIGLPFPSVASASQAAQEGHAWLDLFSAEAPSRRAHIIEAFLRGAP